MAFSVSDILGSITESGVLHSNKFILQMNSPPVLRNVSINGTTAQDTEYLMVIRAEQAKLPGVLIETTDVNRYGVGPNQKMPFNAQFTDTSLTFVSDKNGELYRYFYTWLNAIFDFGGINNTNTLATYKTDYKDNYTTDLHIYVYNNFGDIVQGVTLFKAYPVSFNEVSLDWGQTNQLMKFTVGFTFRDWKLDDVSASLPSVQITTDTAQQLTTNPVVQQTPSITTPQTDVSKYNTVIQSGLNALNDAGISIPPGSGLPGDVKSAPTD
jgi:hypothetical protein